MKTVLLLVLLSVGLRAEALPDLQYYATSSPKAVITVTADGKVMVGREQIDRTLITLRNAVEGYERLMEFQKAGLRAFKDLSAQERATVQANLEASEAMLKSTREEIKKWEMVAERVK